MKKFKLPRKKKKSFKKIVGIFFKLYYNQNGYNWHMHKRRITVYTMCKLISPNFYDISENNLNIEFVNNNKIIVNNTMINKIHSNNYEYVFNKNRK